MDYVYMVKQEWNYYGDYDYNTTICANEESALRVYNEKKKDSIKNFGLEVDPSKIEDELDEISEDKWYYRIFEEDNYYECYEEISVEKKEIVK